MVGNDQQELNKYYCNRYVGNSRLVFVSVNCVPSEDGQGNDVEVCECFHGINEPVLVYPDPKYSYVEE